MRADVKALVKTLTAERKEIDRMLAALGVDETAMVVEPKRRRRNPHARTPQMSDESKAIVVERMRAADASGQALSPLARELAKTYGGSWQTIATGWKRWAINPSVSANGNDNIGNVVQ